MLLYIIGVLANAIVLLYIIGARRRDEALEKKLLRRSWWFQKVVVTLHPQLQRKGGRKCPIHDWRLVTMTADRGAGRANLEACSLDWFRSLLNTSFQQTEIDWRKKLFQMFGSFKNLSYLCTHNPQEKAVRSSQAEEVLSWSF